MPYARLALFFGLSSFALAAGDSGQERAAGPFYEVENVLNAASFQPAFTQNTLVAVFGKNLAWAERWRSDTDVQGDLLPSSLPGTYVNVTVNNLPAAIEYAAPDQVMFLLPAGLPPGPVTLWVTVAGIRGPKITLDLQESAPALYRFTEIEVMAKHEETGEFVRGEMPALPGENIVLFGTGLGQTDPPQKIRMMPREPASILARDGFRVLLNGQPLPEESVGYVGVMPNYPAFYEMHVKLPDPMPPYPEVQICLHEICSQSTLRLRTSPEEPKPEEPQPETSSTRSIN